MTDCPTAEFRDLLPDLLHGTLGAARRSELEAHVAGCADCRAELALLGALRDVLAAPGGGARVDVGAIVRALPSPSVRRRFTRPAWRVAAALVAITLGGASYVTAYRPFDRVSTGAGAPALRIAAAGSAESASAALRRAQGGPAAGPVYPALGRPALPVEGAVGDLSERELRELLAGLRTLDALPATSAEMENASLAPASDRGAL